MSGRCGSLGESGDHVDKREIIKSVKTDLRHTQRILFCYLHIGNSYKPGGYRTAYFSRISSGIMKLAYDLHRFRGVRLAMELLRHDGVC